MLFTGDGARTSCKQQVLRCAQDDNFYIRYNLAAEQLGEAQLHLVLCEEPLRLRGVELVVEMGIAIEDEQRRLHQQLC